jgi:glycosyltransferase involved in cell wall biosynthesis
MTRHPLIDLDLEGEGIGRWVEPGDVAGWAEALRWFESHPSEAEAMGRRARAVAEAHWNYTRFCDALSALLHSVIHERTCSTVESP